MVGGSRYIRGFLPRDIVVGAGPAEVSVEIAEGGEEVRVVRKPVLCAGITHLHTFISAISLLGESQACKVSRNNTLCAGSQQNGLSYCCTMT